MQWTLPKWFERQKILYSENKLNEQKIKAIIEWAIEHKFFHESLVYIPKLSSQEDQNSFLKTILSMAVDTGDLFLAKGCSDLGIEPTQQEKDSLKNKAEHLGKMKFAQGSWDIHDQEA